MNSPIFPLFIPFPSLFSHHTFPVFLFPSLSSHHTFPIFLFPSLHSFHHTFPIFLHSSHIILFQFPFSFTSFFSQASFKSSYFCSKKYTPLHYCQEEGWEIIFQQKYTLEIKITWAARIRASPQRACCTHRSTASSIFPVRSAKLSWAGSAPELISKLEIRNIINFF